MNKPIFNWVITLTLGSALSWAGCSDDIEPEPDAANDSIETGDASDGDGGAEAGGRDASRGAGDAATRMDGATSQTQTDGGFSSSSSNPGGGGSSTGSGGSMSGGGNAGDGGGSMTADGGSAQQSECAQRAKEECDYQKMCDPVGFARDWDGDINQFCIPKRRAACEKGLQISYARSISEACNTWVRQSCDNYRNFTYRIYDSNKKWQYGSSECEVTAAAKRGNKASGADCTADYQCQAGLYCRTAKDVWDQNHRTDVEAVCGKCSAQFAYDGAFMSNPIAADEGVCYRAEMCKAGYQCLSVYGTEGGTFHSFSFSRLTTPYSDLKHCMKTINKVAQDMPCALDSTAQCQDGLVCQLDMGSTTIGTCKVPASATIPTYVGKDARCDPALCDPRLNLECKPVLVNGMMEPRCVQKAIAPIGGFCKNDKKETVAECSQYARCNDNSGQCTRRNVERESCFASTTTPGANDRGSCDPNVFDEEPLVCRQDSGELSTVCHVALPQNLCTAR